MADHPASERVTKKLSTRMWTLVVGLIMFGLGVTASMFWDRIAVEHRTTTNETAIADLLQVVGLINTRLEKVEAIPQSIGGTERQVNVNTKRLETLEETGSLIARQTATELEFTNARLAKMENATEAIATTQAAIVASNHSLLEMAQDVKRLDLLAHSPEEQVSQKEFQAVRTSLEMHEKQTNDWLLSLDGKVSQILTMIASDREKKRISMAQ